MFTQMLFSLFGIVVVHRILSLIEKIEGLTSPKLDFVFVFLQIPFLIQLFFKEPSTFVIIYIGILLIILMLSNKIIHFFSERSFEKLHLSIIQRLLMYISAGQSSKKALESIWNELSPLEQQCFHPLINIFSENNVLLREKSDNKRFYFEELAQILISDAQIRNQLESFRKILSLDYNLRHKSRQSLYQARAQALVCIPIYVFIFAISVIFLEHQLLSALSFISLALFGMGLYFIFKLGTKKRWQT